MLGIEEALTEEDWAAPGPAQVHGPAARVLLPGLPARRLRRAQLGHPGGHAASRTRWRVAPPTCSSRSASCCGRRPRRSGPTPSRWSSGVRITSGENAGDTHITVRPEGLTTSADSIDGRADRHRVRPGQLRADGVRSDERRHRPRRPGARRTSSSTASSGSERTPVTSIDLDAIAAEREQIKQDFLQDESADRPASSARGLHHFALICSDVRRTIEFYQGRARVPADRDLREPRLRRARTTSSSTSATATCSPSSTCPGSTSVRTPRCSAACTTSRSR